MGSASHRGSLKVLDTCISHMWSVLIFYAPIVTLAIIYCFAKNVSPVIRVIIADTFLLVSPLINPNVYSVMTQQIRNHILGSYMTNKFDGEFLTANAKLTWQFFNKNRNKELQWSNRYWHEYVLYILSRLMKFQIIGLI